MKIEITRRQEKPLAVVASSTPLEGNDLAKEFAKHGYDILVAAKNPSVIEEVQDLKDLGVDAVSFQLDLSTTEGVEQLYNRIIATGRPVEALILNSNLTMLAKKILKKMADRGHGIILFAGNDKSGFNLISKEAQGTGVTVTSIMPGHENLNFGN